jgi:CheY-like chemotaxis protein
MAILAAKDRAVSVSHPAPVRHILVVDDNRDAAKNLALLLRLEGHEVRVAHNGWEALRTSQARLPDVVFLDLGLPGDDGFDVARRLRRYAGGRSLFLVALTGWAGEQERCHEEGFDHYLLKPAGIDDLNDVILDLVSRNRST